MSLLERARTQGAEAALERFNVRAANAGEELRLKIPTRTFHGWSAAQKNVTRRGSQKAGTLSTACQTSDDLEGLLRSLPPSPGEVQGDCLPAELLESPPVWGPPSNMAGGDAASRMSAMGQPTSSGAA